MRKIGLTLSKNSLDAPLAQHFGKAKWILIYDNANSFEFVRNEKLIGRYVVDTYTQKGCTDIILNHIGWGAHRHLKKEGLNTWYGPPNVPAKGLITFLERKELKEAIPTSSSTPH